MSSEKERPVAKINYEKPSVVDLGPSAPVLGASCVGPGLRFDEGVCLDLGNSAGVSCSVGNSAVDGCTSPGNSAVDLCSYGYDATGSCQTGDVGTV